MQQLLRYKINKKIGSGGMATVFLAQDTVLGRDVALKMLHPHLLENEETVRRFKNEAQAIAAISHENIVRIFDYGEGDGQPFLVMEYIDGCTLQDLIDRQGTIPNLVLIEVILQIFQGLMAAHANGVYHRDIKATNIMIDRQGTIRIMDFGIAYLVNQESLTLTGLFVGSPCYISPEQAKGKKISGKTDIFSTGILAFQCVTGRLPFQGDNPLTMIQSIVSDQPPSPVCLNQKVLYWLSDFILTCLEKDESKRIDSLQAAETCLRFAHTYGIVLGKKRITEFALDMQEAYVVQEDAELFDMFRSYAAHQYHQKNIVAALKSLNQASVFGTLTADEERMRFRAGKYEFLKQKGGAIFLIGSLVGIGFLLTIGFLMQDRMVGRPDMEKPAGHSRGIGTAEVKEPRVMSDIDQSAAEESTRVTGIQTGHEASLLPKARRRYHNGMASVKSQQLPEMIVGRDTVETGNGKAGEVENGFLQVVSNPPWASVVVNGIDFGNTTPIKKMIILPGGKHHVEVFKEGYLQAEEHVVVAPRDTLTLHFHLVRIELD